jgi:hypothetical protein
MASAFANSFGATDFALVQMHKGTLVPYREVASKYLVAIYCPPSPIASARQTSLFCKFEATYDSWRAET